MGDDHDKLKKGDNVHNKYEIVKKRDDSESFVEIFDNIFRSIREPLLVLDPDLKVLKANHSFYRTFKVNPDKTEGELIYSLGNGQWDIPKLRELLEDILPEN